MALTDECYECQGKAEHQHHVVPEVRGGTRTIPLCSPCHGKAHGVAAVLPELVREGIRQARARGVDWGRGPRGKHFYEIRRLHDAGISPRLIADRFKLSVSSVQSTIYRYKQEKKKNST